MQSPWIETFAEIERTAPGKKPLLAGLRSLTYGDLFKCVRAMAQLCADWGLARGQRVAIATDDDLSKVRLFFSFLRLGVTSVILDPGAGKSEARNLIDAADVHAVFADRKFLDQAELGAHFGERFRIVPIDAEAKPGRGGLSRFLGRRDKAASDAVSFPAVLDRVEPATALPDDLSGDDLAYILFTSGTTSRPKGVEITHDALFAQERTFVRQYGLGARAEILNVLPMFHTDGLTHGPVMAFMVAATVHRPGRFRVDTLPHLLKSIYTLQITHFVTVPAVLSLIDGLGSEFDGCFAAPEFRFLISTAAFLDPALWERLEARFGIRIVNVYGLTETVCEALYCGPDAATRRIGTVGKPVDCEARLVDPEGTPVPVGTVGELTIRGAHVMRGYFRQPETTAEVLKDGWFHTGDLATCDADGFFTIVGRKKNVIITAGINVYPEDVTTVVRKLPGVRDAVTFGLPDPAWGERVVCCIEPVPGASVTVETVSAHCAEHLAREKSPNKIVFTQTLPRGPAGKVLLNEVKTFAEAQLSAAATDNRLTGSTRERLVALAAQQFKVGVDSIGLDSTPDNTAGWNSLAHVEFLIAIEKQFGIKIGARDFMTIHSVGDALRVVERSVADRPDQLVG